jgi:hypothetical protein
MRKKNLHNKEQSDKAQAKKDRELRGELKKLQKANARLTKELQKRESFIPSEPDDMEEVKLSKDVPSVDKCPNCTSQDLADFPTSYNNKILVICRSCKYKWSKVK